MKAVRNSMLYAFYFPIWIGEYTKKQTRNYFKQRKHFKLKDCTFFKKNKMRQLRKLSRCASEAQIMAANSVTLKIDKQKNGCKNVCVHHEVNGELRNCPV